MLEPPTPDAGRPRFSLMTRRYVFTLLAATLTLAACEPSSDPGSLDTLDDQVAYIVGHDLGTALHDQMEQIDESIVLDDELILMAVRAGLDGDSLRFTPVEVDSIMRAFQDTLTVRASASNLKSSAEFLAENAGRDSVEVVESGLQYKVVTAGEGASPVLGDTVLVNYRGTLPDGTEFDSSFRRGQPARFVVGEVIPGWNEALQLMQVGSEWKVFIPADLAYGEQAPPQIGPNRALVFDVELLDVMRGPGTQAGN